MKSEHIYLQDSIQEQASIAGMLLGNNYPWQIADSFVNHINNITADDVQKAAQTTFIKPRLTTTTLLPIKPKSKTKKA